MVVATNEAETIVLMKNSTTANTNNTYLRRGTTDFERFWPHFIQS